MWTCRLRDDAAADRLRAGGKAAGLARLVKAGLPVPDGFVVLAQAMDEVVDAAGGLPDEGPWSDAAVRAEAARRAGAAAGRPLPAGLEREIRARLDALGEGPFAVRSSAVEEDARERSAAGQFETVVDVRGADGVLAAIRTCWAGAHSHRAAIYRARRGRPPFGVRAAVVVQRMAEADVSGVVFTRDPVRARGKHLLVEAARGAGGVVGGGAVERWELERGGASGIPRVLGRTRDALLDEAALRELGGLALAAEGALGEPADVEFAWSGSSRRFALLQLRPVTSPRPRRFRRRGIVWTQRFSGERWIEPVTPLGWSILAPSLERYTHWTWASRRYLHGTRMARLHAGIPFFNVTIFRHLLLKTPWTPTPEFVLELFPPEEAAELRRRRWILPTPGLVARVVAEALLRGRWRGHRFLWLTNPRDWERLAPRLLAAAREAEGRPPDACEALERVAVLRGWIDRYVGVHLWSLLWANLFYQVLGVLLERWGGKGLHARRPALLVGGADENFTVRANLAIATLAEHAAAEPSLSRAVLEAPDASAALDRLRAEPRLRDELEDLLRRFGHRARSTWEVFSPRWRDEPEVVVEMVRAALRAGARNAARDREERLRASRAEAEAHLERALGGGRRLLVRYVLAQARVFSHLRENQRFVFDRLLLAVRDLCRAAGERLAAAGRLARAEDVTFLELDELSGLAQGTLSAPEAARRIAARRAELQAAREQAPPTFLFEHGETEGERLPPRQLLVGLGISPGAARGKVRVARTLEEASRLQPGEVLVTKATDPGWTPYFPAAAGLVTELGGLLSHAAVVAREYGLPAVANVADATRVLRDGEEVAVDGDAGTVRRLR